MTNVSIFGTSITLRHSVRLDSSRSSKSIYTRRRGAKEYCKQADKLRSLCVC